MPRRAPGAFRAGLPAAPADHRPFSRIPGLSPRVHRAIEKVEAEQPGAVGRALAGYTAFLEQPGRWLYLPFNSGDFDDPSYCRAVLDLALRALPPASRRPLWRIVQPLDARFLARTIPDPDPPPWTLDPPNQWWQHCLRSGGDHAAG